MSNEPQNVNEEIFDERFRTGPSIDYSNIEGKHGRRDRRVIQLLLNHGIEGRRCLDVGPGTGRWLQYLKDHNAEQLSAVDLSEEALSRADEIGASCEKIDVERDPLPFESNSFDITLSFMLLEHLKSPELFVRETIRVTRPSGLLLMTIPNIASFQSRIRLLLGYLPLAVSQDSTHVRFYTSRELRELFRPFASEPEIIPTSFSLHPFNRRKLRVPTNRLLAGLDDNLLFRVHMTE